MQKINQVINHAVFFTSWPLTVSQGSGTALFINALRDAVSKTGTTVDLVNPQLDTTDYVKFTLDRLWFNVQLARDPDMAQADWILGLDYDGFALPRLPHQRFIASARALFADLVDTEPEPFRTMLRTQAYFEEQNLQSADLVVTPSEYARGKAIEYYQLHPEKIHVVQNGIDLAEWDALWASLPEPVPGRAPTLLAVSKLYPRKRIDVLVRAVPVIRQKYPDVEVRIVGGGFEWETLRQLSRDTGAEANITWLGDISDRRQIVKEFKDCHVFIHPSIQEAFGNVALESMASSRPLVVSDAAATPDLVRQANSGLIVSAKDPGELAMAVTRLLDDPHHREELGGNGRRFAQQMTWENTAQQFLALV